MFIEQEHKIIWWQGTISTEDDFQNITENAVHMKRQYELVTFTSSSYLRDIYQTGNFLKVILFLLPS